MGLIRKTLAVGTAGIVKPSSKKQRVAKKTLKEMRSQTSELQRQTAILDGSAAREQQRTALYVLRREQLRAGAQPTPKNVAKLRAAEGQVRQLGLEVTDLRLVRL